LGYLSHDAMRLQSDNQSVIKIVENLIQYELTKKVGIDPNFIYEKLENKVIEVLYFKKIEQWVNISTKTVSSIVFYNSHALKISTQ